MLSLRKNHRPASQLEATLGTCARFGTYRVASVAGMLIEQDSEEMPPG
jgi:hypothetical protein